MFRQLWRKLIGVLTLEELQQLSDQALDIAFQKEVMDENSAASILKGNSELEVTWKERHFEIVNRIADTRTLKKQIISARRETMALVDNSAGAYPFVAEEKSQEDLKLVAKCMYPDTSYDSIKTVMLCHYVFAEASLWCLRMISDRQGDASQNGWFDMYRDAQKLFVDHKHMQLIADSRNEPNLFEPVLPSIEEMVNETKELILAGRNLEYDKESSDYEKILDEERAQETDPPRRQNVTKQQIDELSKYMLDRWRKAGRGELFRINGQPPTNNSGIVEVDSGLMLIALNECLIEEHAATEALREIMWQAAQAADPESGQCNSKDDISIETQVNLLGVWEDHLEHGPLPRVCTAVAALLFDIELKEGDTDHVMEVAKLGLDLIDDAWEMIATTKNQFGWDISIERVFDVGDPA